MSVTINYTPTITSLPTVFFTEGSPATIYAYHSNSELASSEETKNVYAKYSSLSTPDETVITKMTNYTFTIPNVTDKQGYKIQLGYSENGSWSQAKIVYCYAQKPTISFSVFSDRYKIEFTNLPEKIIAYSYNYSNWRTDFLTSTSFLFCPALDSSWSSTTIYIKLQSGAILNYQVPIQDAGSIEKDIIVDNGNGYLYFEDGTNNEIGEILYVNKKKNRICGMLSSGEATAFIQVCEPLETIELVKFFISSAGVFSKQTIIPKSTIEINYEFSYLCDTKYTLPLKYNGLISTFKRTIQEQKQDTIGGDYPFIFRNGDCRYAEMSFGVLLSSDLGPLNNLDRMNASLARESTDSSTSNNENAAQKYKKEKEYRDEVYTWLTNGKPKIFKSPTEGIFIVQLMNVTMTPKKELGNLLYEITGTMYEVDNISHYMGQIYLENFG